MRVTTLKRIYVETAIHIIPTVSVLPLCMLTVFIRDTNSAHNPFHRKTALRLTFEIKREC